MAQQYTRKLIRDTLVQMLNEHPIDKITVKDIIITCKINRNTFYYYYPDIYAVLSEIFETELEKVIEEYNDTHSWEESFLAAVKFALNNKKAIYHVYNSMHRDQLNKYLFNVAGNVMNRYVEKIGQGIPASTADKQIVASFYQSALTGMLIYWISSGMKEDPERIILRVGQLFDENVALSLERSVEIPFS